MRDDINPMRILASEVIGQYIKDRLLVKKMLKTHEPTDDFKHGTYMRICDMEEELKKFYDNSEWWNCCELNREYVERMINESN